ncbi:TRAP transporter small permease [Pseudooceanicola marinus]|uniref:TRAP transporter small permease n=1 Tax=Pseudooceanicola marinus TaxID=396013 RepID=UPI001CD2DD1F|nr:TRAP transporter small permease subunit [Pseudooceanicola marinus]MCA1336375.1 TRAP transporter small permease subunit [Pseudooceanicola marinus]
MTTAKRLDRITRTAALFGFTGLVVMALLITWDGAARYLWLPRITGFSDFGEVVFPIVIASCFPAGLLRQTNVTVRVLGSFGGPRLHAALELLGAIVTLAFFTLLTWQFIRLTGQFVDGGRTTRTIGIPLAPWWYVTTAIMAVCVPVQVYVTWSWLLATLRGGTPDIARLRDEADDLMELEG